MLGKIRSWDRILVAGTTLETLTIFVDNLGVLILNSRATYSNHNYLTTGAQRGAPIACLIHVKRSTASHEKN